MNISVLRRGGLAAAVAVSAGAIALAGTLPASAATSARSGAGRRSPAARHQARQRRTAATDWVHAVVLVNCQHHAVILPRSFTLTCADANDMLTGLSWVSWRNVAFGSGTERINTCIPNCAAGHFHSYRALITLWRAQRPRSWHRPAQVHPADRGVHRSAAGAVHGPRQEPSPGHLHLARLARARLARRSAGGPGRFLRDLRSPARLTNPSRPGRRGWAEGQALSGSFRPRIPGAIRTADAHGHEANRWPASRRAGSPVSTPRCGVP